MPSTEPLKSASAGIVKAGAFLSADKSDSPSIAEMQDLAKHLRRHIVTMIGKAGSGHPGGSLSAVEILSTLYFKVMRHNPADIRWADRDRFILSKGHAAPVLYTVLAECGYFPLAELDTLRQIGSRLQGHADHNVTPGVEMSSGSLGQGLSFGIGVALAARMDKKDYRTFVLLGDGECDEGQVWEAAMAAAHYRLDNLTAVVDNNGLQIDGCNCDIMAIEPFGDKWRAFGWHVIEIDGHDYPQLLKAFDEAKKTKSQPTVVIAHTIKGKGVSFMAGNVDFHGKAPTPAEVEKALKELA
ncbi:MAG: transketolase [Dehalococcoidales bacterium]|nr:transketolase [Dehalococcoidales bacterium]